MNREERKELIERHILVITETSKGLRKLFEAIGPHPEGPVQDAINTLLGYSTHLLKIVTSDTGDWIEWFFLENDCGEKGMEAGYGDNMKPIKTVDDLLDLMEEADKKNPVQYRLLNDGEPIIDGDEFHSGDGWYPTSRLSRLSMQVFDSEFMFPHRRKM